MSTSATLAQGQPNIPSVEVTPPPIMYSRGNNLNTLNHDWQGWGSRSPSPLSDVRSPNVSEPKRYFSGTVIKVSDDGWRTMTQGSPLHSHFDIIRPTTSPASLPHESTARAGPQIEKPSAALTTQWFPQPAPNPIFSACHDMGFQHTPPSGADVPIYPIFPPPGPLRRPQELYQVPPPFLGVAMESKFQGSMPIPLQTQAMRPSPFPTAPGFCNITSFRGYETDYSKPPLDPFTDHSFGSPNHVMPPQFPLLLNQVNMANPMFPNATPIPPAIPDSRMIPLVPFDYPPQYFFTLAPQVQFSPPNGPPISPVHQANSLVSEGYVAPQFANNCRDTGGGPGPSPRHSRRTRNLQLRQPRTSSSSSPHSANRNECRSHQGISSGARSSLMQEFHCSNKDKHWTLQDIFGHIVEFSGDQNGSRLIQQQLEEASQEDRRQVFDEIVPSNISQLIQDVFGNYVIQKFFDVGTTSQKDAISLVIENNVINYSVHIYACRVVQKAFDHMLEGQQDRVIDKLAGNLLTCIKDQHGNHVIQKLIDTIAPERLTFLQIISANIPDLAASSTGCRVLQRCLSKLPRVQLQPVLDAIDRHCGNLMRDQYGNYVVQYILQHGDEVDKARVLAKIRGSVMKFAKNQYASHVCEKAITYADPQNRSLLIGEILRETEDGHPISNMMQDDFANYVLQRALAMAEGEQRAVLFQQVKTFLVPLRTSTSTHSKQLIKIERLVDRYFGRIDKTPSEDDV